MANKIRETYVDYSAGSNVLPWAGWLEDAEGNTTAFVDLAGRVHRRDEERVEHEGEMSPRNGAWNAVRDAVLAAADLPKGYEGEERLDYWPESSIACLLSLVMKELGRRISQANGEGPERSFDPIHKDRLVAMLRTCETQFATAEKFSMGVDRRTVHDERDFTGLSVKGTQAQRDAVIGAE